MEDLTSGITDRIQELKDQIASEEQRLENLRVTVQEKSSESSQESEGEEEEAESEFLDIQTPGPSRTMTTNNC